MINKIVFIVSKIYFYLCYCYIAWDRLWNHSSVTLSFCHSVRKHSYGRNFDSILIKFCTVIRGTKSKIEFAWGKDPMTASLILPHFNPRNAFSIIIIISTGGRHCSDRYCSNKQYSSMALSLLRDYLIIKFWFLFINRCLHFCFATNMLRLFCFD